MFGFFTSENNNYPPLLLFNTESRTQEVFEPLSAKEVKIYSCGPTVYDHAHIGNLRAYVFADILKRVLQYNGYTVNHTINFTDFGHLTSDADSGDDKMMKGLKREGMEVSLENMRTLSNRYIQSFKDDLAALHVLSPTQFARASDYVKEQIALIATLEEKGYTYTTDDGVYFDISKFPTYGRLGNIDINALKNGARVEVNTQKRHPADFAVWKNGELGWKSKWGYGFPGWHIECSAMAFATLGKQIDIHTGGVDNIATHHNGEIAQSESATGKRFAKYWMHGEHVLMQDKKIAKSDGGCLYLTNLLEQGFDAASYRYWLLTAHYRSVVNYSDEALQAAQQTLTRLQRLIHEDWVNEKGVLNAKYHAQFIEHINNDLNTPKAIASMWEMIKDDSVSDGDKRMTILEFDSVFGLGLATATNPLIDIQTLPEKIQTLIQDRQEAREAKDYVEADRLRDTLAQAGYSIEDSPQGPEITKKN